VGLLLEKSQIEDYCLRGTALEAMSVFTFIMETYEECIKKGSANIEELMDKKTLTDEQGGDRGVVSRYGM